MSGISELDIRLYDKDGKRKTMPSVWFETFNCEITERGGYGNGSLKLPIDWNTLSLEGNEYIDVLYKGDFIYRGYVYTPQEEVSVPETYLLNTYGLIERLNGFLCQKNFCYGRPTKVEDVFLDIINTYVNKTGRFLDIEVDYSSAILADLSLQEFHAEGQSVAQAFNDLCDMFPNEIYWGCDCIFDSPTQKYVNRIYLRQRGEGVGYTFSVGSNVEGFTYPRDATQIVNQVHLTGGKVERPNLIENGSFEDCVIPGADTTNLLLNSSFEENDGDATYDNWSTVGNATVGAYFRTGSGSVYMDNNPSGEEIYQRVAMGWVDTIYAQAYVHVPSTGNNQIKLRISVLDSSNAVISYSETANITPDDDGVFHKIELTYSGIPFDADITQAEFRLIAVSIPDDDAGVTVDDCAMWIGESGADGWTYGTSVDAYFEEIFWSSVETPPDPYHKSSVLRAKIKQTAGGGYGEVQVTDENRADFGSYQAGLFRIYARAVSSSCDVQVGVRIYSGSTLQATETATAVTVTNSGWTALYYEFRTQDGTDKVAPFIRIKTDGAEVCLDAAGVYLDSEIPTIPYYVGEDYEEVRSTDDMDAGDIGDDGADSITIWGLREKAESNENVVDTDTANAYFISYFLAHATPTVQGSLRIFEPDSPVHLDGMVRIVNLPNRPPPLFTSRIRWNFGSETRLEIELGNERPDLGLLLRKVFRGKI